MRKFAASFVSGKLVMRDGVEIKPWGVRGDDGRRSSVGAGADQLGRLVQAT